jgi:hypothetical protein
MKDDDDVGFDLTAWEAPPPPTGIADAVIARVTQPPVVGAVEAPHRSSRWWIAGGVAAVIAGVASVALLSRTNEEVTGGSGAVATAKPSHLQLGGTAVDLEANTDVWWVREGTQTVVQQPRGTATWKVAANEELVINTGATGASVRASGASLRVEVDMNLSDARLIGTSAVTAAAVALVTVIVYEGHVKVTSAERTVDAPAGTTVQVAPNKPPVQPDVVSGREKRLESKVKFLELENELLRKKLEPEWLTPTDVNNFNAAIKPIVASLKKCRLGSAASEMTLQVKLEDGGFKLGIDATPAVKQPVFECVDTQLSKVNFGSVKKGAYTYAVTFDATVVVRTPLPKVSPKPPVTVDPTPPANCDAKRDAELENKGDELTTAGSYAAALAMYEQILRCRPKAASKAYLSACRARSFAKAKRFFKLVGRESLAQVCLKEGFDPRLP